MEKFYVHTVGAVPASKLTEAISLAQGLADESKAAGALRASYGTLMTGNNAGSIVFQQFFNSLDDFANVMEAFGTSATYAKVIGTGLKVTMRNVAKFCDVPFTSPENPQRKFVVLTRGKATVSQQEIIDLMAKSAPLFSENGAQTFRLARLMTGNNAGDFLLGVTYPSMAAIEATYDALGASPVVAKVYESMDVNARGIIRVRGAAM
ncbi:MAG: hypothetical protein QNL66_02620 [Burkholderiaceae bacterium]|jgi:hypothetical protein